MKVFLVLVLGAAVFYFLIYGQPAIDRTPDEPTPAPATAPAPPETSYKELLQPAYLALLGSAEKTAGIQPIAPDAAALQKLVSAHPPTLAREAALRLCALLDRAASLTKSASERANRPSPRSQLPEKSSESSRKDAEAKDAFFQQSILNEWRSQMAALQAAARSEWSRL